MYKGGQGGDVETFYESDTIDDQAESFQDDGEVEGNFLTSSENENFQPTSLSTPPTTSFSCVGRTPGAYYADPEAGCQLFHRCVLFFIFLKFLIFLIFLYFSKYFDSILSLIFRCVVVAGRFFQFPFLCPNGTVFSEVLILEKKPFIYNYSFRGARNLQLVVENRLPPCARFAGI